MHLMRVVIDVPVRINVGPIHPSTHGVLRLVVDVEGDKIENMEVHIGFLHRGVEKLLENRMYMQACPHMEKLDYFAPMSYDELYVAAVEQAYGIEVKEKAMYVRTILLELQRIASHLASIGFLCNDIGQLFTAFMWSFKDRDMVLKLLEAATGTRMFYVNMRIGGLVRDLPPGFEDSAIEMLDYLSKRIPTYEKYLEKNPVFMERNKGIGVISRDEAKNLGITGPVLRGSGVLYDIRKNKPYYVYEKLNFRIQVRNEGDNFARYKVRMLELRESIRIVREALKKMPSEGSAVGMPIRLIGPPVKNKITITERELPRGECMIYLVADPQRPYRAYIRSANFINLSAIEEMCKGQRFADIFSIIGGLDMVMADVDK